MRQLTAFIKKECMEVWRTGKCVILVILFVLFGIMNPAIAKLTPWMMEQFSDSLQETGLVVTEVTVDALTSWTQYYKNIPMGLIAFLLIFSGIMAGEYQKGTLINMVTKGLVRWKIIMAKFVVLLALWTANYWLCYGITYGYNAYFWDNSIAKHAGFAAFCVYLFGVWLIALMVLMSVIFRAASGVTVGTGTIFFICYLFSVLPDVKKYLPTSLLDASGLLSGVGQINDYTWSIGIVVLLTVVQLIGAIILFNRKNVS